MGQSYLGCSGLTCSDCGFVVIVVVSTQVIELARKVQGGCEPQQQSYKLHWPFYSGNRKSIMFYEMRKIYFFPNLGTFSDPLI
jgi:hypothetical protein